MADARRWLTVSLGLGAVLGVFANEACSIPDPNHCANLDKTCAAGFVCDPCTPSNVAPNGCVRVGTGICALDSGADTDVDPTMGMVTVSTTEGPMTSTSPDTTVTEGDTETTETTGEPMSCDSDDECTDEARPFCSPVLQECVSCSGMPQPHEACEGANPAFPACSAGVCVECTAAVNTLCTGNVPVCDEASNTCVRCTEHAQCGEAACNLFNGSCVAGSTVTVGPAGTADYTTLGGAVTAVTVGGGGTIVVAQGIYNETVTINDGAVVAFLADDGDRPEWQRTSGAAAPQLRVTGGATVLLDGFALQFNTAPGQPAVRADSGALWLDRTIIAQNPGVALSAETTMNVVVRNGFLASAVDTAAVSVTNASVRLEYTTVGAGTGDSRAVVCDAGSAVTVSDSILITRGGLPEVSCASLSATYTASNTALPMPGEGNTTVDATVPAWFQGYNTGDFHLTPGAGVPIFMGIARWNDGDPRVDIDGQPRSGVDGTAEHAGADRP
jgi:hypothetical protein